MNRRNKILVGVLAVLLVGAYFFPRGGEVTLTEEGKPLAGTSNLDRLAANWSLWGGNFDDEVASSSTAVWKSSAYITLSGAESDDAFQNLLKDSAGRGVNLVVTNLTVHTGGAATGSAFRLYVSTSTSPSVTDYTAPTSGVLIHELYGSSTTKAVDLVKRATSSMASTAGDLGGTFMLKYGEAIVAQLIAGDSAFDGSPDHCGSANFAGADYCNTASSTESGLKPFTLFVEFQATTTPKNIN